MLTFPNIDPVALSLGPLKVHWYGLMYLVGFLAAWWLMKHRAKQSNVWNEERVGDFIFYGALGVVLGGRIGYVLFYNFEAFLNDPLMLLRIWQGGMAFHGGLIGVIIAMWLYGRKIGQSFFQVADFVAPAVPIGLGAGRIANFINGELWGRVTDVPWAMVFPTGGPLPRHPSQLYQAFLEGIVFFTLIWLYSKKPRPTMAVSGLFMLYYGVYRFAIEFVRQPDAHLGFIAWGWLTKGQLLSFPMILLGLGFMLWAYKKQPQPSNA